MINADTAKLLSSKSNDDMVDKFLKNNGDILDRTEKEIKKSISRGEFYCRTIFDKKEMSETDFYCLRITLEKEGYTVSRDYGYIGSIAFDISWGSYE